jgi:hypothetical protein
MVIPRENKLVRLYIQMTTTEKGGGKVSTAAQLNDQNLIVGSLIVQISTPK